MNSKKNKFVPAFSLAEALITLLVVCLITLASIPVLTKKKRTTSASEHGRWMCTLNSQGKHVVWSTNSSGSIDNPDTWDLADSDSCTFVPPINARNFAISLSGGGGGGAGVQVINESTILNTDFAVNVPGYYDFLAVGAGGTGGGTTDVDGKSNSGAQGAAIAMRVFLDDSVERVELTKGTVRTDENGGNNNGFPGNASTVKVFGKDKSTGQSYEDLLINAGGGAGGKGGTRGADDVRETRKASNPGTGTVSKKRFSLDYRCFGMSGSGTICSSYDNMYGGFSRDSYSNMQKRCTNGYLGLVEQQELNKFFRNKNNSVLAIFPEQNCDSKSAAFDRTLNYDHLTATQQVIRRKFCAMPGIGGGARESYSPCTTGGESNKGGRTGTHGIVMASTKYFRTGDGGEAGESAKNLFYPKIEAKKIKVYIGAGGKGSESGAGEDGGSTRIEGDNIAIMPVSGGKGGKMNADSLSAMQTTAGGNGEKSGLFFDVEPELPLGGLNYEDPEAQTGAYNSSENGIKSNIGYGSGGGAGAIKFDPNTGQYTKGKGADGAPGAVIIEW